MAKTPYTVFYDSGYSEPEFEVNTVEAGSAFAAAKIVSNGRDANTTYYVVLTSEVVVVEQVKPKDPLWNVLSGEVRNESLQIFKKTPRKKRPK